jgi:outer membrane receptor protein involved in Fe transport
MRLEYQIDSANQLIITPSLSFQNNKSNRLTDVQNVNTSGVLSTETINRTNSTRNGNNLNNNILYSHNFKKRGRTFSVNLNTSYNKRTGESYTDYSKKDYIENFDSTDNRFSDQFNRTFQISARLSYVEPLGAKSQLQFTYNPSWSKSKADQMSYSYDTAAQSYSLFNEQLSNVFDNRTTAQNGGIAFRRGDRDNQFTAGVNYQRTDLYNNRTYPAPAFEGSKAFNNLLPNAFGRFKLSSRSNVRFFYRTNVNQPSITQLQDVVDATNPPFYSQGNPNLKPQYSHSLNGAYTFTNTGKGKVFVANVYAQKSNNYITNATYIVQGRDSLIGKNVLVRNDQLTKPINVDGYYSLRSFLTYAFPVRFIKSNFNMNGGFNYSNIPGVFNNQNIESKNYTYSLGTVISSNVSQYVDFTVSYFANYNTSVAEAGSAASGKVQKTTQNFFSHTGSVQLNLLSKSGWFFQNDLNNQLQWQNTTEQYWLWNMSVGKKFLKDRRGELKLTAFDVLKQNVSFSRSVSDDGNAIYTQRSQVLTQYFLLTFTYNLRNFGKAATPARNNFNRGNFNRDGFNRGEQRF